GMVVAQPVEMCASLAPEVEEVVEPFGRDEGCPRTFPLEQCVGGDRRPVREAIELGCADRAGRREHGVLLPLRGRHLRGRDPSVRDEDGVREGTSDVDAENAHPATLIRRMRAVGRALNREMAAKQSEIRLRGAGGEPVDFRRTLASHGVADLPPNRIDEEAWTLQLTLPLDGKAPRTVRVSGARTG